MASAELRALQQDCDPTNLLADLAILELSLADLNPLFTHIRSTQAEPPQPAAAPTAAKGSAKAPAGKAPAAKAPVDGKAADATMIMPRRVSP